MASAPTLAESSLTPNAGSATSSAPNANPSGQALASSVHSPGDASGPRPNETIPVPRQRRDGSEAANASAPTTETVKPKTSATAADDVATSPAVMSGPPTNDAS